MSPIQKDTIREEFNEMLIKYLEYLDLKTAMFCNRPNTEKTYPELHKFHDFIQSKLDQAYQQGAKDKVEEVSKAYGFCTKCYGKGYATVRYGFNAHADFIGDKSYEYGTKTHMKFCDCDRGKQLEELIKR